MGLEKDRHPMLELAGLPKSPNIKHKVLSERSFTRLVILRVMSWCDTR